MYKKEIEEYLKLIDEAIVQIKIQIHNLDKLGFNTNKLEKELDNFGIEQYKLKENIK